MKIITVLSNKFEKFDDFLFFCLEKKVLDIEYPAVLLWEELKESKIIHLRVEE